MQNKLPVKLPVRQSLGFFPTPLTALHRLSQALNGPRMFIKRDDHSGLALGGNKTRKLEFLLGDALAQGADTIITAGAAQSNHCRQTAAAAASLGLECHLVLGGEQPPAINGNLLLDQLFGCHIHWAGQHRKGEDIPQLANQLTQAGKRPYVVPYGGSNELGAIAFIEALRELEQQRQHQQIEPFSHIFFASSSGGTQAGLMVGQKLLGVASKMVGINIDKDQTDQIPFAQHTIELANKTAKRLGCEYQFTQQDLILDDNYIGEGYGVIGPLEQEAISLTAQTEGILLDPVYTGRAMGGLIEIIRNGKIKASDNVLFWHTGGAPALFAYAEQLQSPNTK